MNHELRELMKRVDTLEMGYSRGSMTIRDAAMPIIKATGITEIEESTNYNCNELDCLKIPDGVDPDDIMPAYYGMYLPGFDCGCEDNADQGEYRFYQVDRANRNVWETDIIRCVAPKGLTVDCTVTSTWSWSTSLADWVFVSNDITGCSCTPVKPGFSGTTNGQSATTTCTGTKTSDGLIDLADSFWRLTIIETLDYYGCDATKLEYISAGVVILTYKMKNRCTRQFCRPCSNAFTIYSCGPSHCEKQPPSEICLQIPKGYVAAPANWGCCAPEEINGVPVLPRFVTFTIPQSGQTLAGDPGTCCDMASGTFVAEWNGVDGWDYYFFKLPLSEADAVAMACGDPGFGVCIPPYDRRIVYKWMVKCIQTFGNSFPFLQLFLGTCPNCEAVTGNCGTFADPTIFPAMYHAINVSGVPNEVNPCFKVDGVKDGTLFTTNNTFFGCNLGPLTPVQKTVILPQL